MVGHLTPLRWQSGLAAVPAGLGRGALSPSPRHNSAVLVVALRLPEPHQSVAGSNPTTSRGTILRPWVPTVRPGAPLGRRLPAVERLHAGFGHPGGH